MKALRVALDAEITKYRGIKMVSDVDLKEIENVMNESSFMLLFNILERLNLKILLNDECSAFFGFEENDQSSRKMLFYVNTFHPSAINVLIKNISFFNRNDLGYLENTYTLKNNEGVYEKVLGVSRTIGWDENGGASHVMSIMCRAEEYSVMVAKDHFRLKNLTSREDDVLKYLVKGFTNAQIAHNLSLSERTIEKHVASIFQHAEIKNRPEFFTTLNQLL